MSATVKVRCPEQTTDCRVPARDVTVHLHPSGAALRVEWPCPSCQTDHATEVDPVSAAALRAAGARVVTAGRVLTPRAARTTWWEAAVAGVIAEAEGLCKAEARGDW